MSDVRCGMFDVPNDSWQWLGLHFRSGDGGEKFIVRRAAVDQAVLNCARISRCARGDGATKNNSRVMG